MPMSRRNCRTVLCRCKFPTSQGNGRENLGTDKSGCRRVRRLPNLKLVNPVQRARSLGESRDLLLVKLN